MLPVDSDVANSIHSREGLVFKDNAIVTEPSSASLNL